MKSLSFLILMSLSLNTMASYSMAQLAGTYEISAPNIPITNIVTLSTDGLVSLEEVSPLGRIQCEGQATLEDQILLSEVVCSNGAEFSQTIDFSNVTLSEEFQAPVYSSLYQLEMMMDFKKL